MPKLSTQQVEQVALALGYGAATDLSLAQKDFSNSAITSIQSNLDDLTAIDNLIRSARQDSMALEVGGVKVDYRQHLCLLRRDGSDLLKSLSALTSVPILHNRYQGQGQSYSFRSLR